MYCVVESALIVSICWFTNNWPYKKKMEKKLLSGGCVLMRGIARNVLTFAKLFFGQQLRSEKSEINFSLFDPTGKFLQRGLTYIVYQMNI